MNHEDLQKWWNVGGDDTLRVNYPLNENSIVLDLGGYEGTWTQKIYDKYQCNIHVFEPIPHLYENLVHRFHNYDKIKIYNFGLSDEDKNIEISFMNDGSSFYLDSGNRILTNVKSLINFLNEKLKFNIEEKDLKTFFD